MVKSGLVEVKGTVTGSAKPLKKWQNCFAVLCDGRYLNFFQDELSFRRMQNSFVTDNNNTVAPGLSVNLSQCCLRLALC